VTGPKRLTCGREATALSLYELCFVAVETWGEQVELALGDRLERSEQ
jgi:hypothetical protein